SLLVYSPPLSCLPSSLISLLSLYALLLSFFFFTSTATPDIYTLSLHDALPIFFQEVRQPLNDDLRVVSDKDPHFLPFSRGPFMHSFIEDDKSTARYIR